jgi:hypothetical protein
VCEEVVLLDGQLPVRIEAGLADHVVGLDRVAQAVGHLADEAGNRVSADNHSGPSGECRWMEQLGMTCSLAC